MSAIFISHRSSDNAEAQALKHWLGGPEPPLAPARVGERRTIRRRCRARPKRLAPGTSMPMVAPSDGDVPVPLIRKARETDVADILEMVGQLARHHGDEPRASLAGLERDLFGPDPWVTALVADGGTSLLGYAVLCRMYRAQSGERGVDLHHLYVVERARSSGVGRRLVEAALDEAGRWGCAFLSVGTRPGNLGAQRFYERLGFERVPQAGPRFRTSVTEGPAPLFTVEGHLNV